MTKTGAIKVVCAALVLTLQAAGNAVAAFPEIPKSLITPSSPSGGAVGQLLDNNTGSWWEKGSGNYPHQVRFDFGAVNRFRPTQFRLLPYIGYAPKDFKVYVTDSSSTDSNDWGVAVGTGSVPVPVPGEILPENGLQRVDLVRKNGRYVILQVLNGEPRTIIYEVWLYGATNAGPIFTASPESVRLFAGASTNCAVSVSEPGAATEIRADLAVSNSAVFAAIMAGATNVKAGADDALTFTGPGWASNLVITASTNAGTASLLFTESDTSGYSRTNVLERSVPVVVVPRRVKLTSVCAVPMGFSQQLNVRLQIADATLNAPGAINLSFGSPSGSSATIALNGDGGIADGARLSSGYIRITASAAVTGVTEVALAVDNNFVFEESGTSNLTLKASVISNGVIYVAAAGSDLTGDGTAANPFRTITHGLDAAMFIKEVRVGAGLYDAAAGEVFPIRLQAGVALIGTRGATATPVDSTVANVGGTAVACILQPTPATTNGLLKSLVLTNFLGGALTVSGWRGSVEDCLFTGAVATPTPACTVFSTQSNTVLTLKNTQFRGIVNTQTAYIMRFEGGTGSLTLDGCTFENISVLQPTLGNHVGVFYITGGFVVNVRNSLFDHLSSSTTSGQYAGGFFQARDAAFVFEGNIVRNISEKALIIGGNSSGICTIRNCLFYNVNADTWAVIGGYATTFNVYNCTFNNCSAPFSTDNATQYGYFHNCSISDCGTLNPYASSTRMVLRNVNVRNTVMANYDSVASSGVTTNAPFYRNAAAGDFHLRVVSPLVDAGNNTYVIAPNTNDLDRVTRILDGNGDSTATVDLGCYEVNTVSPAVSTFVTPKPIYAMIAGTSLAVPVSVLPAATGTPVVANAAYGTNLSGAATLTYPDGAGPSQLVVTADAVLAQPGTMSIVSLTEQTALGVQAGEFGILLYGNEVTVNRPGRTFVRAGETNLVRVSLVAPGAVAPSQIDITPGSRSGSGNNSMAWKGNAYIAAGASASDGYLEIVGGSGINSFDLTVGGGFKFTENGTASLSVEVTGFSSPLYVDDSGNNATGAGTAASPLRTIGYALSILRTGDTVRVLPGTYSAAGGETFPITPGGIRVTGYNGGGAVNPADHVIDGAGTAGNLFVFLNTPVGQDGYLEGLTLKRSLQATVLANVGKVTLTNCLVTTVTSGDSLAAGILVLDNSEVTARNTTFTNLVGRGAVGLEQSSGTKTPTFIATGCRFVQNSSRYGTVYGYEVGEPQSSISLTDCLFETNTASALSVAWTHGASAVWMAGGTMYVERCTFRNGVGGRLFSLVRMAGRVSNSLFVNNQASGGDMIDGYAYDMPLVNCTFANNSGGYGEWNPSPNARLRNCIVANDAKLNSGTASLLILSNVVLWNTPLGTGYSVASSTNVIALDPRFVNAAAGDYQLRHYSPAVDAGDNALTNGTLDVALNLRVRDGNGDKVATVDLGAFEKGPLPPKGTVFVVR